MTFLIKISSLFFSCFVLIHADPLPDARELTTFTTPGEIDQIKAGTTITLGCHLSEDGTVWWMKNNINISSPVSTTPLISNWRKDSVDINDTGDYVCVAKITTRNYLFKRIHITVIEPPKISTHDEVHVEVDGRASLGCHLQGHSMSNLNWEKIGEPGKTKYLNDHATAENNNATHMTTILTLEKVAHGDNGTYVCSARTENNSIVNSTKFLIVTDVPEMILGVVKSVGADSVYLNWTVNEHNEPILRYNIQSQLITNINNGTAWVESENIETKKSSYVVKGLKPKASYRFRISASNSLGTSRLMTFSQYGTTFEKDPELVPHFSVTKKTNHSITIEFSEPPTNLTDFTYFYNITVTQGNDNPRTDESNANDNIIIVEGLRAETNYKIRLAACNYHTRRCGNWSAEQQVLTTSKNAMNNSPDLHTAGVIFTAINTLSLYFSMKYLTT